MIERMLDQLKQRDSRCLYYVVGCLLLLLAGCQQQQAGAVQVRVTETFVTPPPIEVTRIVTNEVLVTMEPVVTSRLARKELVICIAQEPVSLFAYDLLPERNPELAPIFHALYEADVTNLSFGFQAHGLRKLPSLADGDAVMRDVTVRQGDSVINRTGQRVPLLPGVEVMKPDGRPYTFAGTPISMTQMVVDFLMSPRVWSDGQPVTAQDSLFGFTIQQSGAVPNVADWVAHTSAYEAIDTDRVRWSSLPGDRDRTYFTNFAVPLPSHAWDDVPPEEIGMVATEAPIGDGPFVFDAWQRGNMLHASKNPYYYRPGAPLVAGVVFRFVTSADQALSLLLAGECDVIPPQLVEIEMMPLLQDSAQEGHLQLYTQVAPVYEHLDFGINPYGEYAHDRPDWFEDKRVRQAVALCINRQAMVDELLYGVSRPAHMLVPEMHPYFAEDVRTWSFDPVQGKELLDEVGFVDSDFDGVREYDGAIPWFRGHPFEVVLLADAGLALTRGIAQRIQDNLAGCGIEVTIEYLPEEALYGPESPIFERRYDLGLFAWRAGPEPSCRLYHSAEITGPEEEGYCGLAYCLNSTGFRSAAYDAACDQAISVLPGQAEMEMGYHEAQRILSEQLPVVPLVWRVRAAVTRPEVKHFTLDATHPSSLSNLFALDLDGQ